MNVFTASTQMEIKYVEFEQQLILKINNEQVIIYPFLTKEEGNIKLGIAAPPGISVNREEIYKKKQEKQQAESIESKPSVVQTVFSKLMFVAFKSEKLEAAFKKLFNGHQFLTPKAIEKIACGKSLASMEMTACAIDVLIQEEPHLINKLLTTEEVCALWAKPLLKQCLELDAILQKAKKLERPRLMEQITYYAQKMSAT